MKTRKRINLLIFISILAIVLSMIALVGCKAKKASEEILSSDNNNRSVLSAYELGTSEDYNYLLIYEGWDPDTTKTDEQRQKNVYIKSIDDDYVLTLEIPNSVVISNVKRVFSGWYLEPEIVNELDTITRYTFNREVNQKKVLSVYAKWEDCALYTITYNYGNGSADPNKTYTTSFYAEPEAMVALQDPLPPVDSSSTGLSGVTHYYSYTFAAWYTTSNFASGTQISQVHKGSYSGNSTSITVYAKYNQTEYDRIKLVLNGNEADNDDVHIVSGDYVSFDNERDSDGNIILRRTNERLYLPTFGEIVKDSLYYNSDSNKELTRYTSLSWHLSKLYEGDGYTSVGEIMGSTTLYANWGHKDFGYVISYQVNDPDNPTNTPVQSNPVYVARPQDYDASSVGFSTNVTIYKPADRASIGYSSYTFIGWHSSYTPPAYNSTTYETSEEVWAGQVPYTAGTFYTRSIQEPYVYTKAEGAFVANTQYYQNTDSDPVTYTQVSVTETLTVSSNMTLYARWLYTLNAYTITYNLEGGHWKQNQEVPNNVESHTSDVSLHIPTRDEDVDGSGNPTYRYSFDGWYEHLNNGVYTDPISVATTAHITVYAKRIRYKVYKIHFHPDDDTWDWQENKENGEYYSIADGDGNLYTPEKKSYDSRISFVFQGWYIGAQAAQGVFNLEDRVAKLDSNVESASEVLREKYAKYLNGNNVPITDTEIHLYAYWVEKPDTYAITYNLETKLDGEEVINDKRNPTYTSTLNNARYLFTPRRIKYTYTVTNGTITSIHIKAYEFLGWYTAAVGGTKYDTLYAEYGALTLYPHWGNSDEYDFYPGTPVFVNADMTRDNTQNHEGDMVLYGIYQQTKVATSQTNITVTLDGKYYRKEPIMWEIIGSSGTSFTLLSENVLTKATHSAATSSISIGASGTLTLLDQATAEAIKDPNSNGENHLLRAASDYAIANGVEYDEKMGTGGFWLNDEKPISEIALDTATQEALAGRTFYKYAGPRGYIAYTEGSNTSIGFVPKITITIS